MDLKKSFETRYLTIIVFLVILVILSFLIFLNNANTEKKYENQLQSFELADILRTSSNELTRHARAYVSTGNPKWEQKYWEVLDIRNGIKPWANGRIISLQDSLKKLGFTTVEFDKLKIAEENSNDLVYTERRAINLVKGLYDDGNGNFTIKGNPDPVLAQQLLFDEKYHTNKALIMKPIDDFFTLFEQRFHEDIKKNNTYNFVYLVFLNALLLTIIVISIIAYFNVQHKINSYYKELKETNDELSISKDNYSELINSAPDAIIQVDNHGTIGLTNEQAQLLFGYSKEELIGEKIEKLIPTNLKEKHIQNRDTYIKNPVSRPVLKNAQLKAQKKDGSQIHVEVSISPSNTEDNLKVTAIIRDISERIKASEEILKMSLAVEQSTSTIVITDTDGHIEFVNQQFCDSTGYSFEEVVGKNPSILSAGLTPVNYYTFMWNTILAGKVWKGEFTNKKKNGELFIESVSISPLFNENNEVVNFVAVKDDITDRKKLEKELVDYRANLENLVEERTLELSAKTEQIKENQRALLNMVDDLNKKSIDLEAAKLHAESADRLKSAFLATMSHELRTPLNSIIGFTGILLNELAGPLNDEQKKQLTMAKGSSIHLLNLINDVLDISKIEAGELVVELQPVNFTEIIQRAISSVAPLIEKKNLKLITEIATNDIKIETDPRRLEQIMLNLLSNAIKFTDKGSVKIESLLVDKYLVTKVIDTGIGIETEDLDKLFKPFSQLDTGLTRNHDGTGLGLSITKKLIEKLGGTIAVESEMGVGSKFIISLPLNT